MSEDRTRGNLEKRMIVSTKRGVYCVPFEMIIYMEKDLRRIVLHTVRGDIRFYGKFSDLQPRLDERFMCCHRSYIINMDEIVVMTGGSIYLSNNRSIYFGRDTYVRGRRIFEEYLDNKLKKIQ